jgi:hypothetical protein
MTPMIHHDAMNDLRLVVIPAAGHQRPHKRRTTPAAWSSTIPDSLSGPSAPGILAAMLRLTLDTNCTAAPAQRQALRSDSL